MSKKYMRKTISIIAALSICMTGVISELPTHAVSSYSSQNLLSVIITLKEDAVMAYPEAKEIGTDFATSEEAEKITEKILNSQQQVQDYIKNYYPELEIKFSYSTLINGFSCEIPQQLINTISEYPLVKNVSISKKIKKPNLMNAKSFSEYDEFINNTGCTGEGQVIAVIDTEFDISHDMFSPLEDKKTKITYQDIKDINNSYAGFIGDVNIDDAYVSNKIPFIFDYCDGNPYDKDHYHGTHVAGIAAGNEVNYNDSQISGIAPDAQLVLLSAGSGDGYLDDYSIVAAIEDAVKLKVDVINMSFGVTGEDYLNEDYEFLEAVSNAEKAGIIICKSAGNDSKAITTTENPGGSATIDYKSSYPGVMSVASAENCKYTSENVSYHFRFNGIKLYYSGFYIDKINDFLYLGDYLDNGEYEIAIIRNINDFSKANGKIAVFTENCYSQDYFDSIVQKAIDSKATGLIIKNLDFYPSLQSESEIFPMAQISQEYLDFISANENIQTITIETPINFDGHMSSFSSSGVSSDLILEPDITGIGGNVISAAYENDFSPMSGTSMSSPYIAGCAALICEYIEKNGIELSGAEKSLYVRNILMNSAVPEFNNVTYVSPRKQGAGIVNLQNAINDKVIMTGDTQEAKLNLYDMLGDNFNIDLNISNISNEDVNFSKAELVLSTDGVEYSISTDTYNIDGYTNLISNSDLSELTSINAGESKNVSLNVSLDPEQTAKIREIFTNGFFVEGYIILSGADNCCDISVPLLGYYGDWCNRKFCSVSSTYNSEPIFSAISDIYNMALSGQNISNLIDDIYTHSKNIFSSDKIYFSPNKDYINDKLGTDLSVSQGCISDSYVIQKSTGEKLYPYYEVDEYDCIPEDAIIDYPEDGEYQKVVETMIRYKNTDEANHIYTLDYIVDTKKPEAQMTVTERDGRQILSVTAEDENLDGFLIIGKGNSGKADEYIPGVTKNININPVKLISSISSVLNSSYYKCNNEDNNFSAIEKLMIYTYNGPLNDEYNYMDVVISEGNKITLEYDVTDLEYYSAAVSDKAGNIYTYEKEQNMTNIKPGIWIANNRILFINEDGLTGTSYSPLFNSDFNIRLEKTDTRNEFKIYDDLYTGEFDEEKYNYLTLSNSQTFEFNYSFNSEGQLSGRFLSSKNKDTFFIYDDSKIENLLDIYLKEILSAEDAEYDTNSNIYGIEFKGQYIFNSQNYDFNMYIDRFSGNLSLSVFDEDDNIAKYYQYQPLYKFDNELINGDTDHNGSVNIKDIMELKHILVDFNSSDDIFEIIYADMDVNRDAKVNVKDILELRDMFL